MAKSDAKAVVFLTKEGRDFFRGHPLEPLIQHDQWFPCVFVQQSGTFIDMTVLNDDADPIVVEMSIPAQHVVAIVTGDAAKKLAAKGSL